MSLKNKLALKTGLKKEIAERGNKKGDLRYLNFFDLKENEKMTVLLMPDVNGELWTRHKKHGPNTDLKGLKPIRCVHDATGEKCDICEQGFTFHGLWKDTQDEDFKKAAKKWFAREYAFTSVLVLDSPIEINRASDGNEVKIFNLPYAVEKLISEAITEGTIDEDELCLTPLVIKKTLNAGGHADYSSSYFARKLVTDAELEYFEDKVVEPYDYSNLDLIPGAPSPEEVAAWIADVKVKLGHDIEEEEEETSSPQRERTQRQTSRTAQKESSPKKDEQPAPEPESEDDRNDSEGDKEEKVVSRTTPGSLRDRLRAAT